MKTKPVIIGLALLVLSTPLLADDDCDGLDEVETGQCY